MEQATTDSRTTDLDPVHIADDATSFTANGHTYLINQSSRLSVVRAQWLEKYGLYSILGRDVASYYTEAKRAFDAINSNKLADASVTLFNMMRGLGQLDARRSPTLFICALFINRKEEDIADYTEELANQKIDDWEKAGIDMEYFKKKSFFYLNVTNDALSKLIQIYSDPLLPESSLKSPIS